MSKTALITGGSSGLGFELAKNLGGKGYSIIILARNKEKLHKAVKSISEKGYNITGLQCDITDIERMERVFTEIKDKFTKIDFLILNAGVVTTKLLVDYKDTNELKYDLDVNLWGTILSTYIFLPLLSEQSKILIVSSGFGLVGAAGYSVYCAAKAGLINFGEALQREVLHKKISVYVACPGDMDTPQYQEEHANMPAWMKKKNTARASVLSPDSAAARILKKCSGKRFIITSDFSISSLIILKKIFPEKLINFIINKMFPMPSN